LPVDAVLYNTKICIQGKLVEAGLAIDNGKIVKIAKETNLPPASTKTNLKGHITLPGIIDSHVHLRDQRLAYKEDFFTGTAAAAAGGVTSVIDMPNNNPVTMDFFSLKERMKLAEKKVLVNVAFNSAFPKKVEEIADIVKAGAVGFKVYLSTRIGGINVDDDEMLLAAFRKAAENGVPVAVHAEDRKIIEERRREMETSGRNDTAAYVRAHPPEAEAQSIHRIVRLVQKSGVHVHFCHISSALGLNSVLIAKNAGLPVTCEVTPHNLLLSSDQYRRSGTSALTDPPLRTQKDISTLWRALKHGYIDVIASDHAPHALEEKNVNSVWKAKAGVPGLETSLPLLLTQVNEGRLSLSRLVRLMVEEPAKLYRLSKRGFLEEGNWADLVVVDLDREYRIDESSFFSKAKYTPFNGRLVEGKILKTFVNGKLVFDENEIVSNAGSGQVIRKTIINDGKNK
jgi:dihydroorotase